MRSGPEQCPRFGQGWASWRGLAAGVSVSKHVRVRAWPIWPARRAATIAASVHHRPRRAVFTRNSRPLRSFRDPPGIQGSRAFRRFSQQMAGSPRGFPSAACRDRRRSRRGRSWASGFHASTPHAGAGRDARDFPPRCRRSPTSPSCLAGELHALHAAARPPAGARPAVHRRRSFARGRPHQRRWRARPHRAVSP